MNLNQPKKYVCLDIGNVLCHVDFQSFLNKLSKTLNITLDDAMYFMNRTQKLHDLGLTVMADELRDHFKIRSPLIIEELQDAWNNVVSPNLTIIEFFTRLRDRDNLKVALLSNIGIEHAEQIKNKLSHNSFFLYAKKHFSCEVGARKPSMLYYQSFLSIHPEFKGCVYVDDLQENLDASKQFEFKTFKFNLKDYFEEDVTRITYDNNLKLHKKIEELEELILKQ